MADHPMTVDVAMATYHREHDLPELIPHLLAQGPNAVAETGLDFAFRVVIVDNDPLGGAREVVKAFGDPRIHYVVERNSGVTHARNRAMAEAPDTDLLAFIDDDEIPHSDWLAKLLQAHLDYRADVVAGPVYPIFDSGMDAWVKASGIYDQPHRAELRTGEAISRGGTGNMLLDLRTVRKLGVRFDERFGLTGGEDSVFTQQLSDRGARMVWCAEAVADHRVPASRANREYTLNRRYSLSNSGVRAEIYFSGTGPRRWATCAKWAVQCSGSVVKGSAQTLFARATGSLPERARGEIRTAGGLGGLAGLVGATVTPYGKKQSPA